MIGVSHRSPRCSGGRSTCPRSKIGWSITSPRFLPNVITLCWLQDVHEFRNFQTAVGVLMSITRGRLMRNPKTERLLERLQHGEDSAMADLADAYGPKIHQLAFR